MDDDTVRVARWTRWGKDRLYVTLAGEVPAGHVDLIDGTVHPASPEHLEVVTRAAADWRRSRTRTASVPAPRRANLRRPGGTRSARCAARPGGRSFPRGELRPQDATGSARAVRFFPASLAR